MKSKALFLLLFLTVPLFVFAEQVTSNSWMTIPVIESGKIDFNREFNEYKGQVLEENKQYREALENNYWKYVSLIQEMKGDFLKYLSVCIALIVAIGWAIWFYLQKITRRHVDEKTEEIITPEWNRKTRELSEKLEEFFQERKDGARRKSILYIRFSANNDSHFLRQQGYSNLNVKEQVDIDLGNDFSQKDLILLDIVGIQLTDWKNEVVESVIGKLKTINPNIPVILYIKDRWGWSETNFFLMANGKIKLLSAIIECLNINISPEVQNTSIL